MPTDHILDRPVDIQTSVMDFDNRIDNELDNTNWHSMTFRHERLEENIQAFGSNHA
jgi:hypothetical protein